MTADDVELLARLLTQASTEAKAFLPRAVADRFTVACEALPQLEVHQCPPTPLPDSAR